MSQRRPDGDNNFSGSHHRRSLSLFAQQDPASRDGVNALKKILTPTRALVLLSLIAFVTFAMLVRGDEEKVLEMLAALSETKLHISGSTYPLSHNASWRETN